MRERRKAATLTDRIAVAFGSALFAFPLAAITWFGWLQLVPSDGVVEHLSFKYVWYFTGFMAALGFLLLENFLVAILAALMEYVFETKSKTPL
ncbi:hypothetical protein D0B54_03445 [Solimonas sp. K1W22B-7]|uniref:hypothetical protein n=1 Tax=Solimonas sp. K1W22B-7 TaxID=2303331 RepID=UPI000E3330E5|nr:hypothetical protein [Solimonas sp. K1W22B-7]AXQ27783.1 hypothetical protein D0B54_03445 [Solimonas sp. K1W22B-7]